MLRSTVTLLQRCLHGVSFFLFFFTARKDFCIRMPKLFSSGGVGARTWHIGEGIFPSTSGGTMEGSNQT